MDARMAARSPPVAVRVDVLWYLVALPYMDMCAVAGGKPLGVA